MPRTSQSSPRRPSPDPQHGPTDTRPGPASSEVSLPPRQGRTVQAGRTACSLRTGHSVRDVLDELQLVGNVGRSRPAARPGSPGGRVDQGGRAVSPRLETAAHARMLASRRAGPGHVRPAVQIPSSRSTHGSRAPRQADTALVEIVRGCVTAVPVGVDLTGTRIGAPSTSPMNRADLRSCSPGSSTSHESDLSRATKRAAIRICRAVHGVGPPTPAGQPRRWGRADRMSRSTSCGRRWSCAGFAADRPALRHPSRP